MKKINILVIPTIIGAILLSGCGTNTVDETTTPTETVIGAQAGGGGWPSATPTETVTPEPTIMVPLVSTTKTRVEIGDISIEVPEFVKPVAWDSVRYMNMPVGIAAFESPTYTVNIFDKTMEDPSITKSNWQSKLGNISLTEKEDNNGRVYLINQSENITNSEVTGRDYILQVTYAYFWLDNTLVEADITFFGLEDDVLGLVEAESIASSIELVNN